MSIVPKRKQRASNIHVGNIHPRGRKWIDGQSEVGSNSENQRDHYTIEDIEWNISRDVKARFEVDPDLEESAIAALRSTTILIQNHQVNCELINLYFDEEVKHWPTLEVVAPVSDAQTWIELEDAVRDRVRDAEIGDVMIYTAVEPPM